MDKDGGFVLEDIPPGEYRVAIDFVKRAALASGPPFLHEPLFVAESTTLVTIPGSVKGSEFDCGVIDVENSRKR